MIKYQVDADKFDGAKFSQRYGIGFDDFFARYYGGKMYVYIKDEVTISDPTPIFEASDTTKIDRASELNAKLATADLTPAEISELLRLERNT